MEAARQTSLLAYTPAVSTTPIDPAISAAPAIPADSAAPAEHTGSSIDITTNDSGVTTDNDVSGIPAETNIAKKQETAPVPTETFTNWAEEESSDKRKVKASLVLTSTTGAGGARKTSATGILRRPVNPNTLIKTGITEIGNNRYSMPLSFGVGARIDLTPKWSVGVGVNYTLLTRKFEGDYLRVED